MVAVIMGWSCTVRDGLYRDLPLARAWRGLLKSCEREAERGQISRQKAGRALLADFKAQLSGGFVTRVRKEVERSASFLPIFEGFALDTTARDLGGNNSAFENEVLKSLRRLEHQGRRGTSLLVEAFGDAIRSWGDRQSRLIEQHCLTKAGAEAQPIVHGVRAALRDADVPAIVNAFICGKRLPRSGPGTIGLDDDLTRP
jgi:hypothetical protein